MATGHDMKNGVFLNARNQRACEIIAANVSVVCTIGVKLSALGAGCTNLS